MQSTGKEFFRPDEVAKIFKVSRKTIYFWIDVGKLDAERIAGRTLRVTQEAIDRVKKPTIE